MSIGVAIGVIAGEVVGLNRRVWADSHVADHRRRVDDQGAAHGGAGVNPIIRGDLAGHRLSSDEGPGQGGSATGRHPLNSPANRRPRVRVPVHIIEDVVASQGVR